MIYFHYQFFSFCAQSSLLVTSSCQPATNLQLFAIKNGGNIVKLSKIESNTLLTQPNQEENIEIREKDVSIINLYSGLTFVVIIQHPSITNAGMKGISIKNLLLIW